MRSTRPRKAAVDCYDANDRTDAQGTDPINDVEKLKRLVAQLESKIKENFKRADEIVDWRARLAQVSTNRGNHSVRTQQAHSS